MIQEHLLDTPRTAHIFSLGKRLPSTQSAWILLHGYGQSAYHFLSKFREWENENTLLIAPEGLSRFYLKGFDDRVGASWMTKENRPEEINDQRRYIDNLVWEWDLHSLPELNLLGFSQGAAVACRWFQHTSLKVKNLVIWGAGLPIEDTAEMAKKYGKSNCIFMLGDRDEFITEERLTKHYSRLDLFDFKHTRLRYEGGHELPQPAVSLLKMYLK